MQISPSAALSFVLVTVATATFTTCAINLGKYISIRKQLSAAKESFENTFIKNAQLPTTNPAYRFPTVVERKDLPNLTKLPGPLEATVGLIAASILGTFNFASRSNLITAFVVSCLAIVINKYLTFQCNPLIDHLLKIRNAIFRNPENGNDGEFYTFVPTKLKLIVHISDQLENLGESEAFKLFKHCVTSETLNTVEDITNTIKALNKDFEFSVRETAVIIKLKRE